MAISDAGWGWTGRGAALLRRSWGPCQTVSGTGAKCALCRKKANDILSGINSSTARRFRKMMILLNTKNNKDIGQLEQVQQKAVEMVRDCSTWPVRRRWRMRSCVAWRGDSCGDT